MAGQLFRFWSHIDTARGRGRGRRHCGWPNARLQAETLPEVFVEGGVSGGHPVPEGSVELCRESEASYYKTVCSKSQRCRWSLRGWRRTEPSSRPVRPCAEAGPPARPGWAMSGGLSDSLMDEQRGLGRRAASVHGDSQRPGNGGERRGPEAKPRTPRRAQDELPAVLCAGLSSRVCVACAHAWPPPPHSQPQRRCFPLTSPLGGPAGTGETDATFCQFNGAICPVVSDLSVKDTRVFGLFGGLFLRAPLNPRV